MRSICSCTVMFFLTRGIVNLGSHVDRLMSPPWYPTESRVGKAQRGSNQLSTVGTGTTRKLWRYGTVPTWPQPRPQLAAPGNRLCASCLTTMRKTNKPDGTNGPVPYGIGFFSDSWSAASSLRHFAASSFLSVASYRLHQPL